MSLADLFHWLGETAPGQFLAASTVSFAATQSVHLLGMALLGGSTIVADLAALRVIFRNSDPIAVAKGLLPLFVIALSLMAASGVLLVSAGPMKYYSNPLFPWKIATLGLALVLHLILYPGLSWLRIAGRSAATSLVAGASLAAWLTVAVMGRWVGLI